MVHHVSVGSNDIARARVFYDAVLPGTGLTLTKASDNALDYGSGHIHFGVETPLDGGNATVGNGSHVAFSAEDRATGTVSTKPRSRTAGAATGHRASGQSMTIAIMARSSATRTATRSRR